MIYIKQSLTVSKFIDCDLLAYANIQKTHTSLSRYRSSIKFETTLYVQFLAKLAGYTGKDANSFHLLKKLKLCADQSQTKWAGQPSNFINFAIVSEFYCFRSLLFLKIIQLIKHMRNQTAENRFNITAKNNLYKTSSQEYGSPWVQNNVRPEQTNLKTDVVPTYSEIVGSLNDFKRTARLIKDKVIKEVLQKQGINPHSDNVRYQKKTDFHAANGYSQYPQAGLEVGPPIYRTNNMNYGDSRPVNVEIQQKYFPCNSNFTKSFNGGTFKFNGLNTVKTVSGVHDNLNEI